MVSLPLSCFEDIVSKSKSQLSWTRNKRRYRALEAVVVDPAVEALYRLLLKFSNRYPDLVWIGTTRLIGWSKDFHTGRLQETAY